MNKHPGVFEEEIHAYIDGEVGEPRAAEIAHLLANDAELAERIAAFRADKERLQQVFGALSERPLPQEWIKRIEERTAAMPGLSAGEPLARRGASGRRAMAPGNYFLRRNILAVAASLMVAMGSWLTYERLAIPQGDTIIAEALAARQDKVHPRQSFTATALAEPEKRNDVIKAALTMPLKVPDLGKLGYQLTDMRVFEDVPGGKAVELDYRDTKNRLFTLYMRHPSGPARVDMAERDGMWTCIWQDDVLGTVMQGEMSAGEMARIASLAYNGLYL